MSFRIEPFTPQGPGCTVNMQVGPTGNSIQFDNILPQQAQGAQGPVSIPAAKSRSVRLWNQGPATVFVELRGTQGAQTAAVMDGLPLGPNQTIILGSSGATVVAAITQSSSATLYATPGEGGI